MIYWTQFYTYCGLMMFSKHKELLRKAFGGMNAQSPANSMHCDSAATQVRFKQFYLHTVLSLLRAAAFIRKFRFFTEK